MNHARRSRPGISFAGGLWLCAFLISLPAGAAPALDSLPTLESISSRLELTAEQEAQLRPIFEKRLSELRDAQVMLSQASTPQQKSEVLRNDKAVGDSFNAQVESLLSPAQRSEWRELRSQTREKVKERAEENAERSQR